MGYIMKKLVTILIAGVTILFLLSCDTTSNSNAIVKVYLQDGVAKRSAVTKSLKENVSKIHVIIFQGAPSSGGIEVVRSIYSNNTQVAVIETQSGSDRYVVVEAYNSVGSLLFKGESTSLDLEPGKTETVEITLAQVEQITDREFEIVFESDFDFGLVVGGVLHVTVFNSGATVFDVEDIKDIDIGCQMVKNAKSGEITPTSSDITVPTSVDTYNFIVLYGLNAEGNILYAGAAVINGTTPPGKVEMHSCLGDWDEDVNTEPTLHENCICNP